MGAAALIGFAALAGGLLAVAVREGILSAPRIAAWMREALNPLRRVGREGYVPSVEEQRRLALVGKWSDRGRDGPGHRDRAPGGGRGRRALVRRSCRRATW